MADYGNSKTVKTPKDFIMMIVGGCALGGIAAGLLIGLLALLTVLNAIPGASLVLIPTAGMLIAWGIGLGGSGVGFYVAKLNLMDNPKSVIGWISLGLGLIGSLSTIGAILGTFLPVPVLGTIAGAAAGAVLGTLAGLGLLLAAGLITGLVLAIKEHFFEEKDYVNNDNFDDYQPVDEQLYEAEVEVKDLSDTNSTKPSSTNSKPESYIPEEGCFPSFNPFR